MTSFLRVALLTCALFFFNACVALDRENHDAGGGGGSVAPQNGSSSHSGESAIRAIELVQVRWRKVDDSPVSYVPASLPRDHPTGATDGEWIIDHNSGANYFVPFEGVGSATYDHVLASIPTNGQEPQLAKDLNIAELGSQGSTAN